MNYVCSDIHGNLTRFNKLVDMLKTGDHLYILGDCIDRGPDGIEILKYIMAHQKQITLLFGNHEDFMYKFLFMENQDKLMGRKVDRYSIWFDDRNGGYITYEKFKKESEDVQNSIFRFLAECPIIKLLEVNGTKYHLSHSGTICNVKEKDTWYRKDLNKFGIEQVLWDSLYRSDTVLYIDDYPEDYICIFGHVPVQRIRGDIGNFEFYADKNTINIDGGCAFGKQEIIYDELQTALIVYCLDTKDVTYIR